MKYFWEILNLTSYSCGYVGACFATVSKRLGKTRDWIAALKALALVHRRGRCIPARDTLRDSQGAHSNSWDHSAFVRACLCALFGPVA